MISVLKAGFYSSVQDIGRFGYQDQGVPVSGVMDSYSAKLANALLDNEMTDAVLELSMTGPVLQFHCETTVAITGANLSPVLNKKTALKLNTIVAVKKDDVLSFGVCKYGFRAYLAVKEGFKTQQVLGSRSMYNAITSNIRINKGDQLLINENSNLKPHKTTAVKVNHEHFSSSCLAVLKGPEYDLLPETIKELLKNKTFSIGKENNRMAYQLYDAQLQNNLDAIITSVVLPGTVQLTPAGQLIVLMRDCQTTGGYPRVLQLNEKAISQMAQKYNGDAVSFWLQKQFSK